MRQMAKVVRPGVWGWPHQQAFGLRYTSFTYSFPFKFIAKWGAKNIRGFFLFLIFYKSPRRINNWTKDLGSFCRATAQSLIFSNKEHSV